MENGSQCGLKCQPMQTQTQNAMSASGAAYRTLYLDEIEPDCTDKVRVALFLWYWGAGLIIFNLPMEVGNVMLQFVADLEKVVYH